MQDWMVLRSKIQRELDAEEFRTWFDPLEVHSSDARRIVLRAPNEYFVHTLEQGYRAAIDRALAAAGWRGVEVLFTVREDRTPPPSLFQRLRRAGTPSSYAHLTRRSWEEAWGPWSEHEVYREIVGWPPASPMPRDRLDDWLILLYGRYGHRKTGLATSILGEAIERGFDDVRWEDMNTWLRMLRWNNFERYDVVWWRAAGAQVLVFDDVGSIKGARVGGRRNDQGWWKEEVSEILRYRHAEALPTVVTTNGTIEDLGEIDRSLPSRMDVKMAWEMGGGVDYRIEGQLTAGG